MPRVNRDLQRRMAARRDRERRKPAAEGGRYRFAAPELTEAPAPDDTLVADDNGASKAVDTPPRRSRAIAREASTATTRGGVRAAPVPFSAFKAEYSYVFGDLRRVALVIGSLLAILLLLYFVLPR